MNSEILDRLPPQNLEAERAVLGSVILDSKRVDELPFLKPEHFYADANRRLWSHVLAMNQTRKGIDIVTLANRLKHAGEWEAAGGAVYLAEVVHSVAVPHHAEHYARIVVAKAQYRATIHAAMDLLQAAYSEVDEPEKIAADAEAALHDAARGVGDSEPVAMQDGLVRVSRFIDGVTKRGEETGVLTGFPSIDERFGGLFKGEMTALVARPGVGKTAMACQIAHHVATTGKTVYYATIEMSETDLLLRSLCSEANVSLLNLRRNRLSEHDCGLLAERINAMASRKMYLHNARQLSVAMIRRACIRLRREGLALVVVDYLQNLEPRERTKNRYLDVGSVSRELKELAVELGVALLVPAQEGREADKDKKPRLSNVRESGNAEADADNVWFLKCPIAWGAKNCDGASDPADPKEPHPRQAVLIVEKQRNGAKGLARLTWEKERVRFIDPTAAREETYSEFDQFQGGF